MIKVRFALSTSPSGKYVIFFKLKKNSGVNKLLFDVMNFAHLSISVFSWAVGKCLRLIEGAKGTSEFVLIIAK